MQKLTRSLISLLVGGAVLSVVSSAQTHLLRKDSYGGGVRAVAFAGDVNADGRQDILVGMSNTHLNGVNSGTAEVISGVDGSLLFQSFGDEADEYWGYFVSGLGDLNGDGHDDFAVASPIARSYRGLVRIFSGVDGSILRQYAPPAYSDSVPYAPVAAGDLNGDGFADYLMSADLLTPATHAFSGVNGVELYRITNVGVVASIGDVTGDGVPDFIVGDDENAAAGSASGSVFVHSGADGAYLFQTNGDGPSDAFGGAVDAVGDVNGDGTPDYVGGATQFFSTRVGYVLVCSGKDGGVLRRFTGDASPQRLGCSVAGVGDVDGDGVPDILAGSREYWTSGNSENDAGFIKVFSGATSAVIEMVRGVSYEERFGATAAGGVDVNGNGVPDFLVGSEYSDYGGNHYGAAFLYDGALSDAPILDVTGPLDPGDRIFAGMNAAPFAVCLLLYAPDPGAVDLPWLGLSLDIGPDLGSIFLLHTTVAGADGTWSAEFPTPADSVFSGVDFHLQALTFESGSGARKSNAQRTTFH